MIRDVIVVGIEDVVFDIFFVFLDYVFFYVEELIGKRFFLFGVRDMVDFNDLGILFCDIVEDIFFICGGFFIVDRDVLWESLFNLVILRRILYGLNNGLF